MRRQTAVILKVFGCVVLFATTYIVVEVVRAGLAINDRISQCADGTHPDFIQNDAERLRICGYK